MVSPVVMYGCENWTIKKAEHWRIDAFELWNWRRLLRVPWTVRRSNQSILRDISPKCSLEGLMLKLKLQYFAHWCEELTHLKRPWCWERLKMGGEGDDRGWGGWMASPTQWPWVRINSGVGDGQGGLACCSPWGCKELDTTELLNWTGCCIKNDEWPFVNILESLSWSIRAQWTCVCRRLTWVRNEIAVSSVRSVVSLECITVITDWEIWLFLTY